MAKLLSISIMAHKKRKGFVKELISSLGRSVPVYWDTKNDVWDTCKNAWRLGSRSKYHLVLQDDAILCDDFINEAERFIERIDSIDPKAKAFQFYWGNPKSSESSQLMQQAERDGYVKRHSLAWGVAVCIPTELIGEMIASGNMDPEWRDDLKIGKYLQDKRIPTYYPIPCLVDHRKLVSNPSLIEGESSDRFSERFAGNAGNTLDLTNDNIAVCITTKDRRNTYSNTLLNIKKYLPKGARLIIVDDASRNKVPDATFRFGSNVGIATAKNKCIELAMESKADHIFLFDDDCYPKAHGWHIPYVGSKEPHLMYLFDNLRGVRLGDSDTFYNDGKIKAHTHPRGCMLYFHKSAIEQAGGMDQDFGKWGYEHGDLSNRIHNLGLTTFRYADVSNSALLIHSMDEEIELASTFSDQDRADYIVANKAKYESQLNSTKFIPYKARARRKYETVAKDQRIVLTSYFNKTEDPQRGTIFPNDFNEVKILVDSVVSKKREIVILSNCLKDPSMKGVSIIKEDQAINPYFQRWLSYWKYLRDNPQILKVCLVDATDVQMLNDPFKKMKDRILYVGDEPEVLGCDWMKGTTKSDELRSFIEENKSDILLNCGVVCGSREDVMTLCQKMYESYLIRFPNEITDMPVMNYVLRLYNEWDINWDSGRKVTTVFRANETNSKAWFRHK